MVITTKQIRILAATAIALAWLLYAVFYFQLPAYPRATSSSISLWQFPAVWTISWTALVIIDHLGWGKASKPAFLYFLIFVATTAPLGFLPHLGQGVYWAGPSVCYKACATVAIDWLGGLVPIMTAGATVLVRIGTRKHPRPLGWLGASLTTILALFVLVLFHEVTALGIITETASGGLAALAAFFLVSHPNPEGRSEPTLSRNRLDWRQTVARAATIYSILAIAYFLADVVSLPLLLTPTITVGTGSMWVIGGEGTGDGNFLYPLAAFVAYPLTLLLYRAVIRVKMMWQRVSRTKQCKTREPGSDSMKWK